MYAYICHVCGCVYVPACVHITPRVNGGLSSSGLYVWRQKGACPSAYSHTHTATSLPLSKPQTTTSTTTGGRARTPLAADPRAKNGAGKDRLRASHGPCMCACVFLLLADAEGSIVTHDHTYIHMHARHRPKPPPHRAAPSTPTRATCCRRPPSTPWDCSGLATRWWSRRSTQRCCRVGPSFWCVCGCWDERKASVV